MSWQFAWPTVQMVSSRQKLTELKELLEQLDSQPEVETELARLLVVRSAGYLEYILDTCIKHFAEAKSVPAIAKHVSDGLFRGRNPSPENLVKRLRTLSDEWADELDARLSMDDDHYKRELSFMVDRRNKIAHGQSETVRRRKALSLAEISLEIGEYIILLIDPR